MSLREVRQRQREGTPKPALPPELLEANLEHRAKAGLAADEPPRRKHDNERVHGARAAPLERRLLSKHDVVHITSLSFPTLWQWMRAGKFPRSRVCGGKSMWLASEIDSWLAGLPVRQLKGDDTAEVARGGA
jgi:predicted DNA-binding transcriptional regulator AlpA